MNFQTPRIKIPLKHIPSSKVTENLQKSNSNFHKNKNLEKDTLQFVTKVVESHESI